MSGPEPEWITVEETADAALVDRVELALRSAGIEVRVRREEPRRPGSMIEVEVPLVQLDAALEALEPFDAEDDPTVGGQVPGR